MILRTSVITSVTIILGRGYLSPRICDVCIYIYEHAFVLKVFFYLITLIYKLCFSFFFFPFSFALACHLYEKIRYIQEPRSTISFHVCKTFFSIHGCQ